MNGVAGRGVAGELVAVVPVKRFTLAKQRLDPVLTAPERVSLARAMLEDVLAVLAQLPELAVRLVTTEPEAVLIAARSGAGLIAEPDTGAGEDPLNAALGHAAAVLAGEGARGILVVPGDVPGVTADELRAVIAAHPPGVGLSLAAAHDRGGTNALLATPPTLIGFRFGLGSFQAHREAGRALGLVPVLHGASERPGLAGDIDLPGDLPRLAALPADRRSRTVPARDVMARAP